MLVIRDSSKVGYVLYGSKPEDQKLWKLGKRQLVVQKWHNSLSNYLYDYCTMDNSRQIWETPNKKYVTKEMGNKKFAASNFLKFEIIEEKSLSS